MLSFQSSLPHHHHHPSEDDNASPTPATTKCTPNLLPCGNSHDGPVDASARYWRPEPSGDNDPASLENTPHRVAYLRGRKLLGKEIPLPGSHRGVFARPVANGGRMVENVWSKKGEVDRVNGGGGNDDDDDVVEIEGGEEDQVSEVKVLEEIGEFEEVIVWGHDEILGNDDVYVRGLGEWIGFADGIHSFPGSGSDGQVQDQS